MKAPSQNPIINLYSQAWHYVQGRRQVLVVFVSMFICANLTELIEPLIIGNLFNIIQSADSLDGDLMSKVFVRLAILLAIPFIFWSLHGKARLLERETAFFIMKKYKRSLLDQVMKLPIPWHRNHHSGKIISRVNRSSKALFDFSQHIFEDIYMVIRLFGSFAMLLFISPLSGFIALAVAVIAIIIVVLFDKKLTKLYDQIYESENYLSAGIFDYISNINTVITMGLQTRVMTDIRKRIESYYPSFRRSVVVNELKWAIISFIIAFITLGMIAGHTYLAIKSGSALLIGTLYTIYAYLQTVGQTFYTIAGKYSTLVENSASLNSAHNIIKDYDRYHQKQKRHLLPPHWQKIAVENLYFQYVDEERHKHHLDNITLNISRGAKIAFVGASGCGKSTALGLLRGIFQPKEVLLKVDDKAMPHGLKHINHCVTLIPQEPEIFENTISYNLTLGAKIQQKDLNKALKIARFDTVLKRIPKRLSANIAEKGVNLSGGEKQRLALARGLIIAKNNPILLLDEPTSSVDPRNELKIYQQLFSNWPEKTVISALHRLHLLKLFDYIYVFSEGKIIEQGRLDQLIKSSTHFREIWRSYFKTHKTKPKKN